MTEQEIQTEGVRYLTPSVINNAREAMYKTDDWRKGKAETPREINNDIDIDTKIPCLSIDMSSSSSQFSVKFPTKFTWKAPDKEIIENFRSGNLNVFIQEIIKKFGIINDLTVDLLDLCLFFLFHKGDGLSSVTVSANEFLELRGIKPQINGKYYKSSSKALIEEHLMCLNYIHISIINMPIDVIVKNGKRIYNYNDFKGPLFNISSVRKHQRIEDERGNVTEEKSSYYWHISPGYPLEVLFKQCFPDYINMNKKVFELSPSKHWGAKRIAKYIFYLFRVKNSPTYFRVKVSTLLEKMGLSNAELRNHNSRYKLRACIEGALDILENEDIIRCHTYDATTWDHDEHINARNWFDRWLNSIIVIHATDDIIAQRIEKKPKTRKKTNSESYNHLSILEQAVNRGMTQTQLCQKIGVSKTALSLVLNGKRPVSKALAKKIEASFPLNK